MNNLHLLLIVALLASPVTADDAPGRSDQALKPLADSLKALLTAAKAEDADGVREHLYASTDSGDELTKAQAARIVGSVRLYQAIARKLGDDTALEVVQEAGLLVPGDLLNLLLARWSIKGDVAKGEPEDTDEGEADAALPAMRKVNGEWKLDITTSGPPADPVAAAKALRRQADAAEKATQALSSSKVDTEDGVRQILKEAPPIACTDRWTPAVVIPAGAE